MPPFLSLSGNASEIGFQHGSLLKDSIRSAIRIYQKIFARIPENELLDRAASFSDRIAAISPSFVEEIEAIARGAAVDRRWIYALNCRTELMPTEPARAVTECTTAFFAQNQLLGQNWDWCQPMTNLVVVMEIRQIGKPAFVMLTEPGRLCCNLLLLSESTVAGIIGKIGFNCHGLGCTLNWLTCGEALGGV